MHNRTSRAHVRIDSSPQLAPLDGLGTWPLLKREGTVPAGRHPARPHGGLDGDGSGSAARVHERGLTVPTAPQHQGRGKRLPNRRCDGLGAPATHIQRFAARIERHGDEVVVNADREPLRRTVSLPDHLPHPFLDRVRVIEAGRR